MPVASGKRPTVARWHLIRLPQKPLIINAKKPGIFTGRHISGCGLRLAPKGIIKSGESIRCGHVARFGNSDPRTTHFCSLSRPKGTRCTHPPLRIGHTVDGLPSTHYCASPDIQSPKPHHSLCSFFLEQSYWMRHTHCLSTKAFS